MESKRTENARMRGASGNVEAESRLNIFLYLLGRDHLPLGEIESLADQTMGITAPEAQFTNGWLAEWAKDIERRLLK